MTEQRHISGQISQKVLSLRVLIPLLIVLIVLLMLVYVFGQQIQHEDDEVYSEYRAKQMEMAERLQANLERDMRMGFTERLQQSFSELSLRPEVLVALLADEQDRVIASSRLSLTGSNLMQAAQQFSAQPWLEALPTANAAKMTIQQTVYRERNAILVAAPVRLDAPGAALGHYKIGKLLIYTDVTAPLAAHRLYVRAQMQRLLISFTSLALLIGLLLHWTLTRRVVRLLHAAEHVGEGNLNVLTRIGGPDEIGRLGLAFDGMVRKMAQSSAQIRKLSLAVEQSPNSIIITDADGIIEYVNPHFCKVTEYAAEEVIGKSMRVHQSGQTPREVYEALWNTIKSGRVWRGELLNRSKHGRLYWEELCISPILDDRGGITHFLSEQIDITARKLAEEQIHLFEKVFANANEAILISDANNNILAVNPAFTEVTGYTPEEAIGKNPRIFASGLMDEDFYRNMWLALKTDGKWQGEVVDRRKDGEIYAEWLSISTLRDSAGKLTHYIALMSDISERKAAEERMAYLAQHDVLTGLPNRMVFQDRVQQAITYAGRQQTKVALLFMDLDRFKNVNDTLGHHVGDLLLQEVAQRILQCVRSSDTVSRQGGDEFVIMLPNLDDLGDIVQVVNKLIENVATPYELAGYTMHVTTSVGVSIYPQDGHDSETLLRNADTAMYQAKDAGRNRYRFFTQEMNNSIAKRVRLENMLRNALKNNELLLHYQPKVDLRSGEIVAVEALVRWQHPDDGLISPADFIPIAEETGMIVPLGEWVINEACRQTREWREMGLRDIVMAVNLSPLQFLARDLMWVIFAALTRNGLPGSALEFEITESAMMANPEKTTAMLQSMHELGARISIDDFGTGYSSLAHLKKFPIDVLKIDQSFVRDLSVDNDDAAIVKAVIGMAQSLSLNVIAEGVETTEQLRFLEELDCDEMQGYYFSKPLPADEFRKLMVSGRNLKRPPA
ncbi:MAG: EAL domain-containing protein [Nitrosomonadales bacterium]|nr:EAL domain-containing protein [Nitrosomonadales bacterium]